MNVRRTALQALKAVDRAAGLALGPRQVLVEARTPMNVVVLRPIWETLRNDGRVAVAFSVEEEESVRDWFAAERLDVDLIPRERAPGRRFDLAMNADPWNALPLRRCWRRLNFFHGVAGKYDLDDPRIFGSDLNLHVYDRVMFANEDRYRRYVESGVVSRDRAALVGFPKVDDLVNGKWNPAAVRTELGLSASLATVLYAPTFSPAASLQIAGDAIVEALLATGLNVVVKLHDRSMVPHPRFTAGVDWPRRLARFEGHPRYAFARGADSGPYLAAADVLVTDHSTVGFEFGLLNRPVVVFDAPDLLTAARINPEKWRLLRSMADVVRTPAELTRAVEAALRNPARLAERRRTVAGALFAHAGRATDCALDVVYELLCLARPAAVPAARPLPEGQLA